MSLNIPDLKTEDAGVYVCVAKNDFGTETSMINVTVKGEFIAFWQNIYIYVFIFRVGDLNNF